MDPEGDADTDHGRGTVEEARSSAPEESRLEAETEGLLNVKASDGEFSSASSSSHSSLPSTLPPSTSSMSPPVFVEEEKETGCSKSFTGLKLFGRR